MYRDRQAAAAGPYHRDHGPPRHSCVEDPAGLQLAALVAAHRDRAATIEAVGKALTKMLGQLDGKSAEKVRGDRRKKYLDLGSKGLAA